MAGSARTGDFIIYTVHVVTKPCKPVGWSRMLMTMVMSVQGGYDELDM
jgi:hypothetical protein